MVFTGIIQEMGTVVAASHSDDVKLWDGSVGKGLVIKIQPDTGVTMQQPA